MSRGGADRTSNAVLATMGVYDLLNEAIGLRPEQFTREFAERFVYSAWRVAAILGEAVRVENETSPPAQRPAELG